MTDEDISRVISYCVTLWPHSTPIDRKEQILAWRRLLSDVDVRAAEAAVDEYAASYPPPKFPPPAGEIRQRAIVLADDTGAPSPDEAWEEIGHKIATIGYQNTTLDYCQLGRACVGRECGHHTVTFSHPAVTAVVDAMGWRELCLSSEQMADRAHFLRMYAVAVERLTRQNTKPPSVTAFELARPLTVEGPRSETVRPLPSGSVEEEERDDEVGLCAVREIRDKVAKARRLD